MIQTETTAPNFKLRWAILGMMWTATMVVFLNRLSVGPLAPFLKTELSLTNVQVGMAISAASLGWALSVFPAGLLVHRSGPRKPVFAGQVLSGVAMIALFFFPSYSSLLTMMFLSGLGGGILMPAATEAALSWFGHRERATALGLMQTPVAAGGMITAAVLPMIALSLGWRYSFLLLGIATLTVGVAATKLYRTPPVAFRNTPQPVSGANAPAPVLGFLRDRNVWLIAMAGFFLCWIELAVIAYLILYLRDEFLLPVTTAGIILAIVQLSGVVGRPGFGFLSDRLMGGRRRGLFILLSVGATATSGLIAIFGAGLSWMVYPVLFLLGLCSFGFGGLWLAFLNEHVGLSFVGKATGFGIAIATAGAVIGPIAFGAILDQSGSYRMAWISEALIGVLAIIALLLVRESPKNESRSAPPWKR